ncbi:YdaS family helix-turn-helix protein [Gilliamella sp. B2838]|uniref:YdaS family helix-turn-helix protein n=1 Tax=Gilliamella sp. B2838 TaxID=2818020 RepID=UPI003A5CABC5
MVQVAIKRIGTISYVSRKFGFKSVQSVANWVINNHVPAERVIQLCVMCNWTVTPHQLRPDLYPNMDDGMPNKNINTN